MNSRAEVGGFGCVQSPTLHVKIARAPDRDPRRFQPRSGSDHSSRVERSLSAASTRPVSRCASPLCCCRVFKGWALSLCLFLLRLSLLMTPPFVPTPHLSVSQELRSPAEEPEPEPERPATRPPSGCGHPAQAAAQSRVCGFNPRRPHLFVPCCSGRRGGRHPCHLNDVTRQAN